MSPNKRAAFSCALALAACTYFILAGMQAQAASPVDQLPTQADEAATYSDWGWTWNPQAQLPQWEFDSSVGVNGYTVNDPDIHGDTEGEDLWTYLAQYARTGNAGYLTRANAWVEYFKNDFAQCVGSTTWCNDRSFGYDHAAGWGLVSHYETTGQNDSLTAAENIAADIDDFYRNDAGGGGQYPTPGAYGISTYGPRGPARHLILASRLAEASGKSQWISMRDQLVQLFLQSPDWNDAQGMYFVNEFTTSAINANYGAGDRMQIPFQLGLLAEAFWQVYRTTGNTDIRDRLIKMARWVERNGLDPATEYTPNFFGVNVNSGQPVYIDKSITPSYTTSLVNLLMMGYKLTGDTALRERAKYHLNRGTKGVFASTDRTAADDEVHHFVDTRFFGGNNGFYFDYNKGELQYTYLIFDRDGNTSPTPRPNQPTNLQAQ